jgi:hypothetical protein
MAPPLSLPPCRADLLAPHRLACGQIEAGVDSRAADQPLVEGLLLAARGGAPPSPSLEQLWPVLIRRGGCRCGSRLESRRVLLVNVAALPWLGSSSARRLLPQRGDARQGPRWPDSPSRWPPPPSFSSAAFFSIPSARGRQLPSQGAQGDSQAAGGFIFSDYCSLLSFSQNGSFHMGIQFHASWS